jgi:hypothetical protein
MTRSAPWRDLPERYGREICPAQPRRAGDNLFLLPALGAASVRDCAEILFLADKAYIRDSTCAALCGTRTVFPIAAPRRAAAVIGRRSVTWTPTSSATS